MESLRNRLTVIQQKLEILEKKLNKSVERVKYYLKHHNCHSFTLIETPVTYYSWELKDRAKFLGVRENQLCKSLIMENTAFDSSYNTNSYSKYYCFIIQYSAKFNNELSRHLLSHLTNLPKRKFHFVLASDITSYEITGFTYNSVSPFALLVNIPIIICQRCVEVKPSYLFLGGGDVNVKLGISTTDLINLANAKIGLISDER